MFLLVFSIERGANIFLAIYNAFVLPWQMINTTPKIWRRTQICCHNQMACMSQSGYCNHLLVVSSKVPSLVNFSSQKMRISLQHQATEIPRICTVCCCLPWAHHEQLKNNFRLNYIKPFGNYCFILIHLKSFLPSLQPVQKLMIKRSDLILSNNNSSQLQLLLHFT